MLFAKVKDFNLRKNFLKFEQKKRLQKFVFINFISKFSKLKKRFKKRNKIILALYLKKKINSTKVKIVRRCLLNDRTRNVNRPLNLSRSIFRELLQFGLVPGYKKAVW
jgi:ribosomal protein S14